MSFSKMKSSLFGQNDWQYEEEQPSSASWGRKILPSHCAWVFSASMSVVTSRYILGNLNWHYPFHLLSLQLLCFAVANVGLIGRAFSAEEPSPPEISRVRQVLSDIAFAVSMPLFIQAIFHTSNVITLCMLSAVIFLPSLVFTLGRSKKCAISNLVQLVVFVLGVCAIVADDYRLTVPTMALAIPVSLLSGLQSSFGDDNSTRSHRRNIQQACIGLVVALLLCYTFEISQFGFGPFLELNTLDLMTLIVLCLNLIATTAALYLGASLISPIGFEENSVSYMVKENNWFALSLSVMTTALTAAGMLMIGPITRTSSLQITGYVTVVLAVLEPNVTITAGPASSVEYTALPLVEDLATLDINGKTTGVTHTSRNSGPGLASKICSGILVIITFICWAFVLNESFLGMPCTSTPESTLNLDSKYTAKSDLDIVISMYKEPAETILSAIATVQSVPSIASRNPRFLIYTKDENGIDATSAAKIPATFTHLPNIGREGETYLNHILRNWDDLANQTIFLQAELHNEAEISRRLDNFFGPDTGMLSLGFSGHTCDCDSCADGFGWNDVSGILSSTYSRANNAACGTLLLSYKGQFAVSAKRIRGVDRAVYADLQNAFVDPGSWAHGQEYLQGREDSLSRPYFGYTMERLWSGLMQCSEQRIARDCPSLLGGWRSGGDRGDCQCFDE